VNESLIPGARQTPFQHFDDPLREFVKRNFILAPSNVMVRRSAFEECGLFDETVAGVADWEMWFRLARRHPFIALPEPLVLYRRHPGQLHLQERPTRPGRIRAHEKTLAWAEARRPDLAPLTRRMFSRELLNIAYKQWSVEDDFAEGLRTVRRARSVQPWNLRAYALEFRIMLSLGRQFLRSRKERVSCRSLF
jgi:hypothetical protein